MSAGPNSFLSERARHSYDVEEDEEEVEEVDASVRMGLRHFAAHGIAVGRRADILRILRTRERHFAQILRTRERSREAGLGLISNAGAAGVVWFSEVEPGRQAKVPDGVGLCAFMAGRRLWGSTRCFDAGLQQLELYPEGVKGPVVARFCCEVVHGLCVHALEIPQGCIGGVSRENLNPGNLNSTAAEKLDAPYSERVTTEQFSTGCGMCGQAQLMGSSDDGGNHTLLGRRKSRRLWEKG